MKAHNLKDMKEKIEEARKKALCYYHDLIAKCLEVHDIDLTTIISDCVTAGYEARADEVIELRVKFDQKVSQKLEYEKLYEEAKDKLYKAGIEPCPIRENNHSRNS